MNRRLMAPLLEAGAAAAGAVAIDAVWQCISPENRKRALRETANLRGLICGIFPYYHHDGPGNLSLYARGLDYHIAVKKRLQQAVALLRAQYPDQAFSPYVDASPYPEKRAAAAAGLGVMGANTLLIAPDWGSYVFIGAIATSLPIAEGIEPKPNLACRDCGRCMAACPTGALDGKGMDPSRCLSALTQQKGELDPRQIEGIRLGGMIWGCDICQKVCPENAKPQVTKLKEFREDIIGSLSLKDLQLSNKGFQSKFGNRAFAWRGPGVLRRNMDIILETPYTNGKLKEE